jgi:predicted unusual protein kinase regulating ubiquinone biosynthesis (AarF/ABC1/UbiB family)
MFSALVAGESQRAASLFIERARTIDPSSVKSVNAFREDMACVLSEALGSPLQDMDVGQVVQDMLALSREHGVPLDTACVSLIMSVAVIEGIARQLSDDFNVGDRRGCGGGVWLWK